MKVPALLKNKYVCYALMALATLNVIGYVSVKAWECLALFSLAGYSAHCYCKNVSLAILAALFVANFVFGCGRVKEGFEEELKGKKEHMADIAAIAEGITEANTEDDDDDKEKELDQAATAIAATAANCCDPTAQDYLGATQCANFDMTTCPAPSN